MEYIIHLLILVGIYVILAQSFNVIFGLGFQFNLAHVAVYAIGAYTTALLATGLKYCPLESICIDLEPMGTFSCIVFSMLTSGLLAFLIGGISLKLALDYFAIGTIAFSSVISALLINWKSLTRGVLGIPGIPRPEVMGLELYDNWYFLAFVCVLVVFTLLVVHRVFYSALGRGLRAQSQHPYAVQALGKNAVCLLYTSDAADDP